MASVDQYLEAGALVPVKAKPKSAAAVDDVSARCYAHPALDTPVVRLCADNLAAGEDLTMDYLGFAEPEVTPGVAKRTRQAIGFPEWALINDPKHAKFALELVKEFRKESRRARSKPGHAYEAFSEIADRLGASVAHFLPSFWEQVGRDYIVAGNATYASRAFGKAREAENVHGLKIDEQVRRDAFLEFALAGCVSAKALTEYGKELQTKYPGEEAWQFMRDLSVRRTMGGLPPWTAMCKDLASLVKAAGLDVQQEIQSVLAEILESPAISRASLGFWKAADKYVAELVKGNPEATGRLLNMIPQRSAWQHKDIWPWLDYLHKWGVLSFVWEKEADAADGPAGGAAAWISRIIKLHTRPTQRLYDVLQAAAEVMKQQRVPLEIYRKSRWGARVEGDVDFVDLALELNVPLVDPPPELTLDLSEWAKAVEDGEAIGRPRDPVFLSKNERLRTALLAAVEGVAGSATFEKAARGKQSLWEARRDWLNQQISEVACYGLPATNDVLHILEKKTTLATFEEFPDSLKLLAQSATLPSLTHTLNAGLFDEYGWPQLEAVVDRLTAPFTTKLDRKKNLSVSVYGSFPYAIVCDGMTAVVIRGEQIVEEIEVRIDAGEKVVGLHYLDGALLVEAKGSSKGRRFWNHEPQTSASAWLYGDAKMDGATIDMPEGGTFFGGKVVHAGDASVLEGYSTDRWFGDGENYFRIAWSESDGVAMRQLDLVSGKTGRKSMPTFFEDYITDDAELQLHQQRLYHYGEVIADSPLGVKDGTHGVRCRQYKDGRVEAERIDGATIRSAQPLMFVGMLDQAGTDRQLPIVQKSTYGRDRADNLMVMDPEAEFVICPRPTGIGQALAFNDEFLHFLKVRDVATSKKLRKLRDKDLKPLVAAEAADYQAWDNSTGLPAEGTDFPQLDAAILKLLPKLNSDRLFVGLRSAVIRHGRLQRRLERLQKNRDPNTVEKKVRVVATGADATIEPTLRVFATHLRSSQSGVFDALAEAVQYFSGRADGAPVPMASLQLMRFCVEHFSRKLWYLNWIHDDNQDRTWHEFAEAVAATGVLELPGRFRFYSCRFSGDPPFTVPQDENGKDIDLRSTMLAHQGKTSRFLIGKEYYGYWVAEYTTASFEPLPGSTTKNGKGLTNGWSAEQVRSYLQVCAQRERQLPDVSFLESLAADMGLSLSEVALIWLGYPNMTSRTANFMPAHLRTALKLKTRPLSAAKSSLDALSEDTREGLVAAMLEGPAAQLWDDHAAVGERLKAAWQKLKPDRLDLPMELMDELSDGYSYGVDARKMFVAINKPHEAAIFSPQVSFEFDSRNNNLKASNGEGLSANELKAAVLSVCLISSGLPVGHPSRAKMPAVREALLAALDNPNLMIETHDGYWYDEKEPQKAAEAAVTAVLGKTKTQNGQMMGQRAGVTALVNSWRVSRFISPGKLKKAKDYQTVREILQATTGADHEDVSLIETISLVRSTGFKKLCERLRKTPVPDGQYESNPRHACPKLVAAVAKQLTVSEDAAVYYLQLLALHNPTDKLIKLWNGWTAARIKKAAAELVEQQCVLEAKRARAGRRMFLPGGWEALKAPHLPLESWKLPLYDLDGAGRGHVSPLLERIVPLEPIHLLFERAWQRVQDGEAPRYEEV